MTPGWKAEEETDAQSCIQTIEVAPTKKCDNDQQKKTTTPSSKKTTTPRKRKPHDLSQYDFSQRRLQHESVLVNRHKVMNAVNTYETKVQGARTKFEEVSRGVRGLQYYTHHGNKDMASIDLFLCVYDEVPTKVTSPRDIKKRDDGPQFFIQARPNYPVRKLSKLFTTMGKEMAEGKTSGDNWKFGTSGSELLSGLFGEKEGDKLIRDAVTGAKSAKILAPVYGPGYKDRNDKNDKFVNVIQHYPTNKAWKQKFKNWGPPSDHN